MISCVKIDAYREMFCTISRIVPRYLPNKFVVGISKHWRSVWSNGQQCRFLLSLAIFNDPEGLVMGQIVQGNGNRKLCVFLYEQQK